MVKFVIAPFDGQSCVPRSGGIPEVKATQTQGWDSAPGSAIPVVTLRLHFKRNPKKVASEHVPEQGTAKTVAVFPLPSERVSSAVARSACGVHTKAVAATEAKTNN